MKPTTASEQKLILGLRAADQQAFGKVYDAYHSAIYNLCARIVGDREEAKDLTQEVFLRAFSSPPAPRAELGLRPWLYRVATNLCLNHLRAAGTRGATGGDEVEQVAAPVDGFQQSRTVALVEETLGQLNERYRTALVLKDLHGLPSEELAGVMETSRASADVLVHRARASFRTVFSRLAGEGSPVPGNLALVLAPLAVPAALQVMPPLPLAPVPAPSVPAAQVPHGPVPVAAHPVHPAHPLDASAGGLLGKLSAALGSKVAVTAAAASLVAGGLAVEKVVTDPSHPADGAAAAAVTVSEPATSGQVSPSGAENQTHTRGLVGHGCPSADSPCIAEHLRAAGHDGASAEGTHAAEHGANGERRGTTAGPDSTETHESGASTTADDGGSGSGSGSGSGGHDDGTGDGSILGGGSDTSTGQHD